MIMIKTKMYHLLPLDVLDEPAPPVLNVTSMTIMIMMMIIIIIIIITRPSMEVYHCDSMSIHLLPQ